MLQHSKILNQLYSSFIILNNEILTMGQGYLVIIILYILCNITCLIFVISSYCLGEWLWIPFLTFVNIENDNEYLESDDLNNNGKVFLLPAFGVAF